MDHSWRESAACRSHEPDLFFSGGETGPTGDVLAKAKAICASCPVQVECLDYAITARPRYGVWGGLSQNELRVVRKRRLRPAS